MTRWVHRPVKRGTLPDLLHRDDALRVRQEPHGVLAYSREFSRGRCKWGLRVLSAKLLHSLELCKHRKSGRREGSLGDHVQEKCSRRMDATLEACLLGTRLAMPQSPPCRSWVCGLAVWLRCFSAPQRRTHRGYPYRMGPEQGKKNTCV